jgi:hypothetical protein
MAGTGRMIGWMYDNRKGMEHVDIVVGDKVRW